MPPFQIPPAETDCSAETLLRAPLGHPGESQLPPSPKPRRPLRKRLLRSTPIFLLVSILLILLWSALGPARPLLSHDTALGLLSWEHWQQGGGFNTLPRPNPGNLARETEQVLSCWTPVHSLPAGLLNSLGLSLGDALAVSAFLSLLGLLLGWLTLARTLGCSLPRSLLLASLQLLSCHPLAQFSTYDGAALLVQAGLPWLLLAAWHLRGRPLARLAWLPALLLFASLLLWHPLPLSRGETSAAGDTPLPLLPALGHALLAPWLTWTGAGVLLGQLNDRLGQTPGAPWLEHPWPCLLLGLGLLVPLLRSLRGPAPDARVRLLVSCILILTTLAAVLTVLVGAASSQAEGLFYAAGTLLPTWFVLRLPPGAGLPPRGRRLALLLLLPALVALGLTVQRDLQTWRHPAPLGRRDLPQHQLTPDTLAALQRLDEDTRHPALFFLPAPEIALEIRHHRRFTQLPSAGQPLHGHGPRLVVLAPAALDPDATPRSGDWHPSSSRTGGSIPTWRPGFADYPDEEWTRIPLEDTRWQLWVAQAASARASAP